MRPHVGDATEFRRPHFVPGRWLGAFDPFDESRCVATYRSFDTELTLPGGATLAVDAVTGVTVSATHRRRGLLTGMIGRDLAAASRRGTAAAILIAAEYNIYGRYGFGPATRSHGWNIDLTRAGGLRSGLPEPAGGRIAFATMAEVRKLGPELHERWRRTQPGAIDRKDVWWKLNTGEICMPGREWKEPYTALHRDADGTVTGLITYRTDDHWDGGYPDNTLTVTDFLALDPATAVALWRFAFSVDWVRKVVVENIGPDDPLPLLLNDPRAATPNVGDADSMWLRVLDVPTAFDARTYGSAGRVVLAVSDRAGYAEGHWALEVAADGTGRCTRTDEPADLALGVSELSSLYLGAETVPRLAAAALVAELRPGAAADADLLLRTPLKAWNPDGF
jgi:predicted acetyltransferase